ncbi:MAG: flavin reductase family protein [Gammaproteobacteria bacterium]|nr:flavin reductase family protein [Gammaproteobacteria bacterium]
MSDQSEKLIELDLERPIWDSFFNVYPLVVIGTKEPDGTDDLAPKHLAIPVSWENFFGFVCTPKHRTYQNIVRTQQFTVTYARPTQVVLASLAATPRCEDGSKPIVDQLPTIPAKDVDAVLMKDGYLFLECTLHKIYDDFGNNSLITGRILSARVANDALRIADGDDQQLLQQAPLLAYLYPGRFAEISNTQKMPLPKGFKR